MFFKQVKRNASRNRKGNGIFFGSLILAIIAFYTFLSLDKQDVMIFLGTIESDAVNKLMSLIPFIYAISLFFVFFLVYFACKYQTDNRRREFGMYLMLGMKRSRLFFMLICETLWNSVISLVAGLPLALLLTETISLVSAKLIGLGIIGHTFSFSSDAIIWTVCGYAAVQLLSMLIICIPIGRTEPASLLSTDSPLKQKRLSALKSTVCLILGITFLLFTYYLGVFRLSIATLFTTLYIMLALLVSGVVGTFLLLRGLGGFVGRRISLKSANMTGLSTFTGRQVQENVLSQHKSLAVASLLLLVALASVSYGIAVGPSRSGETRSVDFTIRDSGAEVEKVLSNTEIAQMTATHYLVYLDSTRADFNIDELKKALGGGLEADSFHTDYIISLSSYNSLRSAMGKEELILGEKEVALYTSMSDEINFVNELRKAFKNGSSIGINGEEYRVIPGINSENIVANRAITLYSALIVNDALYFELADDKDPYCTNLHIADSVVEEKGLLQAILALDEVLASTGLEYESYLGGIGRNLFYSVAASYLTIYLGVLFMIIANTVIGLKFLLLQRKNKHRYITLQMLGASCTELCASARKQINTYFGLALSIAVINSVFAIITLFTNFTKISSADMFLRLAILSLAALALFIIGEVAYITVVKRTACREIKELEIKELR